jgi:hypothetical protein
MHAVLHCSAQAPRYGLRKRVLSHGVLHKWHRIAQQCAKQIDESCRQSSAGGSGKEFQKCSKMMADLII